FLFLLAIPNLSQDFYRFIWDGRMILEGFNPYLYAPESFILNGRFPVAQAQELYNGMGVLNGSHLTNYTPLNQLCFVIAELFSGGSILGSVIIMRLLVIAADFGTLYFGKKLLKKLNIPVHTIFWYILNPFIIIELTGNLHFEGVMIFFLIWSLYLLHNGKWKMAAIIFACSVSVKLIPLIFLPLLFQWFVKKGNVKKGMPTFSGIIELIGFYAIVVGLTILTFIPFYNSELTTNYFDTVALWFQRFEFNASFYYIAREIGYTFRGYNEIAVIGKIIPIVIVCFVLILSFFRKNKTTVELITAMLFALSFYYFTATTVHPWYLSTLVVLSLFTKYKFPLVWSFVIILSYLAYSNANNTETLWIVGAEYAIVYGFLIWELLFKRAISLVAQT
ncbi:MAG TPA: hypothetical protein VJ945_07975, partial [Flavobacteriaceae bacterium]|nr:hypothetical protein [Flavobacteriaceae bacterium]